MSSVAARILNMSEYQGKMPSPPAFALVDRLSRKGTQMFSDTPEAEKKRVENTLDFAELVLTVLGGGALSTASRRVRRGFGVGVDLEPGEEAFDISGLTTGYR